MRALRWSSIMFGGVLVAVPALSQVQAPSDHLTPEPSVIGGDAFLSDYDAMIVDVLREAYDRNVMLRMIVEPSFSPEYVVGIKQDKDKESSVFTIAPEKMIWSYEALKELENGLTNTPNKKAQQDAIDRLRAQLPGDYRDLKLRHCQIGIDSDLAARITKVWRDMLLETQYVQPMKGPDGKEMDTETIGLDGVTYHFFLRDRAGFLTGQSWSPSDNKPAMLVEVAETMAEYCEAKNKKVLTKLSGKVDALAARFQDR